ncbi:hypothetical protein CTE07_11360 [Chitinophaga terrae (ex Kim and Jung 2007)]|nr:hypothetical protein CTE07_11360 [Chitinophaga terrae (ex Kim and Jung 2007)]
MLKLTFSFERTHVQRGACAILYFYAIGMGFNEGFDSYFLLDGRSADNAVEFKNDAVGSIVCMYYDYNELEIAKLPEGGNVLGLYLITGAWL